MNIKDLDCSRLDPDYLAVVAVVKQTSPLYTGLDTPGVPKVYQQLALSVACGFSPFSMADTSQISHEQIRSAMAKNYEVLTIVDPIPGFEEEYVDICDCFDPQWGKRWEERKEMMATRIWEALAA